MVHETLDAPGMRELLGAQRQVVQRRGAEGDALGRARSRTAEALGRGDQAGVRIDRQHAAAEVHRPPALHAAQAGSPARRRVGTCERCRGARSGRAAPGRRWSCRGRTAARRAAAARCAPASAPLCRRCRRTRARRHRRTRSSRPWTCPPGIRGMAARGDTRVIRAAGREREYERCATRSRFWRRTRPSTRVRGEGRRARWTALWARRAPGGVHPPRLARAARPRRGVGELARRSSAAPARRRSRCADAAAHVLGDAAFVVCVERIPGVELVATNVFVREDGQWRMVHHHASSMVARRRTGRGRTGSGSDCCTEQAANAGGNVRRSAIGARVESNRCP